jgi:hypothetical protein
MKAFLKLCAICLITFLLISPVLIVWKVWQSHSDLIARQRFAAFDSLSAPSISRTSDFTLPPQTALPSLAPALTQPRFQAASAAIIPVYLGFTGAVLLGFYSGLLLNHRYQTRRHRTLKQQVAALEKIWQQSIY